MFRSGLERGHNEAIPALVKTPDDWRKQNLEHHLILSHVNSGLTCRDARKEKRPFARRVSRKRSWSSSYFALPDVPDAPTRNIVLAATSDH